MNNNHHLQLSPIALAILRAAYSDQPEREFSVELLKTSSKITCSETEEAAFRRYQNTTDIDLAQNPWELIRVIIEFSGKHSGTLQLFKTLPDAKPMNMSKAFQEFIEKAKNEGHFIPAELQSNNNNMPYDTRQFGSN